MTASGGQSSGRGVDRAYETHYNEGGCIPTLTNVGEEWVLLERAVCMFASKDSCNYLM